MLAWILASFFCVVIDQDKGQTSSLDQKSLLIKRFITWWCWEFFSFLREQCKQCRASKRHAHLARSEPHCTRLRVVPLSLGPSCVTRKKTARKKWPREILQARSARKEGLPPNPKSLNYALLSSPPGFHADIFFGVGSLILTSSFRALLAPRISRGHFFLPFFFSRHARWTKKKRDYPQSIILTKKKLYIWQPFMKRFDFYLWDNLC